MTPVPSTITVLVVSCQGRTLAIPRDVVSTIAVVVASPPLPLAQPWVGGVAALPEGPGLLVEPFGMTEGAAATRSLTAVGLRLPVAAAIALVVDGTATLGEATLLPPGPRASVACPAGWLRPARLADGRDLVVLMPEAITSTLREAA